MSFVDCEEIMSRNNYMSDFFVSAYSRLNKIQRLLKDTGNIDSTNRDQIISALNDLKTEAIETQEYLIRTKKILSSADFDKNKECIQKIICPSCSEIITVKGILDNQGSYSERETLKDNDVRSLDKRKLISLKFNCPFCGNELICDLRKNKDGSFDVMSVMETNMP